jgi:hypothetical protein
LRKGAVARPTLVRELQASSADAAALGAARVRVPPRPLPAGVLAPHAEALAAYVLNQMLPAYIPAPRPAAAAAARPKNGRGAAPAAAAGGGGGGGGGAPTVAEPGHEVAAKCAALKALTRALTPEPEAGQVRAPR